MRTPFREAGSLINQSATVLRHNALRHPRTGTTVLLSPLPATTELVIVNLVPQQDPQTDPKFASCSYACFPQTFLKQFAAVKTLQFRILAYCVYRRLAPEKSQQRIYLVSSARQAADDLRWSIPSG